ADRRQLRRPLRGVAGLNPLSGHGHGDLGAVGAAILRAALLALFDAVGQTQRLGCAADHTAPQKISNHSFPNMASSLSFQTFQTASRMIFFDILDSPNVRSTNTMGISASLKPFFHARKLISIWKA